MAKLSSSGEVNGCRFLGNHADQNGGGVVSFDEDGSFRDCTFRENEADLGGGIYNFGSIQTAFQNCTFVNNAAAGGGAMFQDNVGNALIMRSQFQGNRASGGGGAVFGVYDNSTYADCLFTGNASPYGGVIETVGTILNFSGCTLAGNVASESGGGLYAFDSSDFSISDCILWGNSPDQFAFEDATGTIQYSDIEGGVPDGILDSGANIQIDPKFVRTPNPGADGNWDGVDDDYGDLRLQAGSPCINAGNPAYTLRPGETDLDGHARLLCGQVDMGAYEFGIGNANCDQVIDVFDFGDWNSCVTGPGVAAGGPMPTYSPSCAAFDFDGNLLIDLWDFAQFAKLIGR